MPKIEFTDKEVTKVKSKLGIYKNIPNLVNKELENNLKQLVTQLIERAFRNYCKAHHADKELTNREWSRFNKFLQKVL